MSVAGVAVLCATAVLTLQPWKGRTGTTALPESSSPGTAAATVAGQPAPTGAPPAGDTAGRPAGTTTHRGAVPPRTGRQSTEPTLRNDLAHVSTAATSSTPAPQDSTEPRFAPVEPDTDKASAIRDGTPCDPQLATKFFFSVLISDDNPGFRASLTYVWNGATVKRKMTAPPGHETSKRVTWRGTVGDFPLSGAGQPVVQTITATISATDQAGNKADDRFSFAVHRC